MTGTPAPTGHDGAATTSAGAAPGRAGDLATAVLGLAALVALGATVAVGLSLPGTSEQGDYARLIAIHPPVAWAAYVGFGLMAVASAVHLWKRSRRADLLAGAAAEVGALFTALMLITGSIWGRPTWGVWWVWDARLTLSALMLALLLGYLALRRVPGDPDVRSRRSAVAAVLATLVIPINHFAVEWWRTLHQGRSLAAADPSDNLDGIFIVAMLIGFVAMTTVEAWLLVHRYRVARLEADVEDDQLTVAVAERRAEAGDEEVLAR
jgi:heme exporter protein C